MFLLTGGAAETQAYDRFQDERWARAATEKMCSALRETDAARSELDADTRRLLGNDAAKVVGRCDYLDEIYYYGWWQKIEYVDDGSWSKFRDWCGARSGLGDSEKHYNCFIPPYPYWGWRYLRSPLTWLAVLALLGTALWKPMLFPAFVRWRQGRLEPRTETVGAGGTNITIRQARPLSEWFKAAYWIGRLVLLAIPTLWILGHMEGALDLLTVFVPEDMRPAVARFLQGLAGKISTPPQ